MDKTIGTNSLRGGRKIYGHKTLISNWIEETYRPNLTPAGGFTTSRFVTTTMEQQATGYSGQPVVAQTFGSGVKRDDTNERFDYGNVIAPDKQSNSKEWKTVTQDSKEFCTSFAMKAASRTRRSSSTEIAGHATRPRARPCASRTARSEGAVRARRKTGARAGGVARSGR